jgi:hypothetical protein
VTASNGLAMQFGVVVNLKQSPTYFQIWWPEVDVCWKKWKISINQQPESVSEKFLWRFETQAYTVTPCLNKPLADNVRN